MYPTAASGLCADATLLGDPAGSPVAPPCKPADSAAPSPTDDTAGNWLVLGVYADPIRAARATELLAAGPGSYDVHLLTGVAPYDFGLETKLVAIRSIDLGASKTAGRSILSTEHLSLVWSKIFCTPSPSVSVEGQYGNGLFLRLEQHLDDGAAILIVRAADTAGQLRASRTVLAAKCDMLLTHEIASKRQYAEYTREPSTCCDNCATGACEKRDLAQE